jgi:hypothetical protein
VLKFVERNISLICDSGMQHGYLFGFCFNFTVGVGNIFFVCVLGGLCFHSFLAPIDRGILFVKRKVTGWYSVEYFLKSDSPLLTLSL